MDRAQTVRFPLAAAQPTGTNTAPLDLETNPEEQDLPSHTVVLTGASAEDTGSSALAQLDALSSLVHREARQDDRRPGASGEHPAEGQEESLDDYMKQFMERLMGKKMEVAAPAPTVQPLPTVAPPVEVRQPARAPECSASLYRMRDLANASTRSAIHVHQCHQLSSSTLVTFLPAAVASLASSASAAISAATGSAWWQAGSAALLLTALAFAWRFWTTSRRNFQNSI